MAGKDSGGTSAAGILNLAGNPRILAFDLGQKCGVATFDGEELTGVDLWNFDSARRASLGTKYLAFKERLEREVAQAADLGYPLYFVYEAVDFAKDAYAAHAWGAMEGILHMVADTHNIPVAALNVMTIKKFAAGSGKATKDEVRTQARILWPQFRWGEDQADAAMAGLAHLRGAAPTAGKHA